nr:DUF6531 domain-containing protein [Anaeromyxobacter dehalogenans]
MTDTHTCILSQRYYCGTQQPAGPVICDRHYGESSDCWVETSCSGYCAFYPDPSACVCDGDSSAASCTEIGSPQDLCAADDSGNGIDDDFDGCIDEGCTIGEPPCTCTAACSSRSCNPATVATCDPFKADALEVCGNGTDENCNGLADEGCAPEPPPGPPLPPPPPGAGPSPKPPNCLGGVAGADPILLATRSAVTEPFTDFSVSAVVNLGITRTYSSADASLWGGPVGVFGRGWHHDWEATLSCLGEYCTVVRGIQSALVFRRSGNVTSVDGTEVWEVFRRGDTAVTRSDNPNVLVRRPNSTWTVFMVDGTELRFATVCDSCGSLDRTCVDPREGGAARLVEKVDPYGNVTYLSYDRPGGILIGLSDDLGHSLELRSANACSEGLVRELRYDGQTYATYGYQDSDLGHVQDADGNPIRTYVYGADGLLHAVVNEAGVAVAEFAYAANGEAVGVIDATSDVSVGYASGGMTQVTERFGATSVTGQRTLDPDGLVTSVSDNCSCGPATMRQWVDRRLVCETDPEGHVTYRRYDEDGRLAYTARFASADGAAACPPNGPLPKASTEEWYDYGSVKEIATSVTLPLERVITTRRRSSLQANAYATETVDYTQATSPLDPVGYQCTGTPLPAGSVACRRLSTGYTRAADGSPVLERHATFNSYDPRGRLIGSIGPVNLDRPSISDVVPLEERTYWPDDATLVRRGRLHEVKRYASPGSPPLITAFDYDAFGPYTVVAPNGTTTVLIKDVRGRTRFALHAGRQVETRFYDGSLPRLVIDSSGSTIRTGYDLRGRVELTEYLDRDPDEPGAMPVVAWSESTRYDPAGNPIHVERRDANGLVTWQQDREYDVRHRVVMQANPARPEARRTWAYGASGFLESASDEDGRKTVFHPDPLRRIASIEQSGMDASGVPVQALVAAYQFQDYQDSLSTVTDGKGQRTTYGYDDFGRLIELWTETHRGGVLRFAVTARRWTCSARP